MYDTRVPIISAFFGIIIRMYFDDHAPPHFHAEHQGQDAMVDFQGRIVEGEIASATARNVDKRMGKPSSVRARSELAASKEVTGA